MIQQSCIDQPVVLHTSSIMRYVNVVIFECTCLTVTLATELQLFGLLDACNVDQCLVPSSTFSSLFKSPIEYDNIMALLQRN